MSARVGFIGAEPVIVFEEYEDGTALVGHFLRCERTADGIDYPSGDVQVAGAVEGYAAEPIYGAVVSEDASGA